MSIALDRPEFTPPQQPGLWRAFGLALLAHVLLALALAWGTRWQRDTQDLAVEAELWASVPVQAAPPLAEPPPPPPAPTPVAVEPPAPSPTEADIVLERERKLQAQRKAEEAAQARAARKQEEARHRAEEAREQAEAERAAKAAEQARAQREAARLEADRKANLARMQGLAGGTGAPSSAGTAQRSAGPSDSYGGRVRARVRPNIVFTEAGAGNPVTEVEVRLAPDGTITSRKVVKSSGVPSWDEAVLRALDKTEVLPRDIDGSIHTPLSITFRPRD